jgi:TolB protein
MLLLAVCMVMASVGANAQLKIDITRGVTDPVPVAVVPFSVAVPANGVLDVASVIEGDLVRSGRFRGVERNAMPARPDRAPAVDATRWRAARADYVVVGRLSLSGANVTLRFDLVNALNGQTLLNDELVTVPQAQLRKGAHRVADAVFQKLTGVRGAFSTRIAYVTTSGAPPAQSYQLMIADADGENWHAATTSPQPIMSPTWSPDGAWLAYVSFENKAAAIFVQEVSTGKRRQVSARAGHNGAPSWR